ncbi:hypothetical protein MTO96_006711 [Rhipicephalus appendiculatus]
MAREPKSANKEPVVGVACYPEVWSSRTVLARRSCAVQCQARERTPQVHVPVTEFQREFQRESSESHRPPGHVSSAHRCPTRQFRGALAAMGVVAAGPTVLLVTRQALFGLDHDHREPREVNYRIDVPPRSILENSMNDKSLFLELFPPFEVSVVVSVEGRDEVHAGPASLAAATASVRDR